MSVVVYSGAVENGRFRPLDGAAFSQAFIPFNGKTVLVWIKEKKRQRSNPQNRYWFGVIIRIFMEYMGYPIRPASQHDIRYVHEQVLIAIGHFEMVKGFGGNERRAKSTHNLPTDVFGGLIEAAQRLGAENNLYIPDPDSETSTAMIAEYEDGK